MTATTGSSGTPAGDTDLKPPIEQSYWVIPGRLLAGEYPGHKTDRTLAAAKVSALISAGIDTFVDLTEQRELTPYAEHLSEDIEHIRVPIRDMCVPTVEEMRNIVSVVQQALQRGRRVYVHCWGGIGRTGTVIGCFLAEGCGSGTQALQQLAALWTKVPKSAWHPQSPQTEEQWQFVLRWAGNKASPSPRTNPEED